MRPISLSAFKRRSIIIASICIGIMSLGLSACITLLPEVKPVRLYSFSYNPLVITPHKSLENGPALPVDLFLSLDDFPKAAASDRIVTREKNEISFVGGGRWATQAQGLFNDVLSEGFARDAKFVRVSIQARASVKYRLSVEVRRFEVHYVRNKPTVKVAFDARIVRQSDGSVLATRFISSQVLLRKSDQSLIVEGFEKAASQSTADLIDFAETIVVADQALSAKPKT
jgi:cholesterol transport system auxiliary component